MAQILPRIVIFRSQAFKQGYVDGRHGKSPRWCKLAQPLDEEALVLLIRNLLELYGDGELTEDLLRQTAGLIVGWSVTAGKQ